MAGPAQLVRLLKVLSVDTRVRIVQLLRGRPLCVGALAARLDVTQGAVSQHLRVMRDAGLVIDDRRGYFVHYRLNERTLEKWRASIDQLLTPEGSGQAKKGAKACAAPSKKSTAAGSRRT